MFIKFLDVIKITLRRQKYFERVQRLLFVLEYVYYAFAAGLLMVTFGLRQELVEHDEL